MRSQSPHWSGAACTSTMAAATVESLLANLADNSRTWRVAANYGASLIHLGAVRIGPVETAAVLPLVDLDARLSLGLVLSLVQNIFGALTLYYFAVHWIIQKLHLLFLKINFLLTIHHQVVQELLVNGLLQNGVVASETEVSCFLILGVKTLGSPRG